MKRANLKKEIKAESFAEGTKPQKQYSDTYLQSVAARLGFGKNPTSRFFSDSGIGSCSHPVRNLFTLLENF